MTNFKVQLGVKLDKNAGKALNNQLNNQKIIANISKFNITKSAISDIKKQLNSSKFSINIDASGVNKQINSVVSNINKMNKLAIGLNNLGKLNIDDSGLQQRLASITKQFEAIKRMSDLGAQSIALSKLDGNFKILSSDISTYNKELANGKSINFLADQAKAVNNVKKYINENTKAAKEYGTALEESRNKMQNATNVKELTTARKQFAALTAEIQASGNSGRSFSDELKNSMSKFGQWISAGTIVMQVVRSAKDLFKNVVAIDSAMTNLYKVTDETDRKYNQFLTNASSKAVELGRSLSSLIEMTATWAKLGFSLDDSAKLSEVSAIYANVGEVDDETAVKDIVTALKSFNIEAKNAITVVDKLNKLGNEFATDSASLGDGLKNSASALAFAGNDINQTLAMITGGSEITQNASEQSNAIKVLSMRLRGKFSCLHIEKSICYVS
ncbi:phage tail tape measure protein [Thomasclavelia cocleata]|uniref:Phage tail tape measure protein, TP901 family, core region n=1 Tax=Thomasclavelia cocleata TaxID=69824 RepID=A0A1I0BLF0_9FIRM|nr:phage tail tape measure protein [Thomasclavelia cocleata]MCR1960201.1 phage tail tape measure protein [Thomasclavelia cocleata]NDO41825.1 phage tail tape measure protein [Thomasclavelia cocleata]PJN79897.1 phage tail tape measure protein [Thomasclavelia cocleata]SET07482.1 phage tail tape measure protein, TP901 family, core region [Thomasclavelia cocleata]